MKFKLVESIDDRLVEKIDWTDEQIRDIIDMYVTQGMSTCKIANKYNTNRTTIGTLLKDNNIPLRLRADYAERYLVYLNTITYIGNIENAWRLSYSFPLEYKPSIKLGNYTTSEIFQIYKNLHQMITEKQHANTSEIFAFYMKLLKKGNIKQLLPDLLSNIRTGNSKEGTLKSLKLFPLLTIDDTGMISDKDLVEFYSYKEIAERCLTEVALKVDKWGEPTTDSGKYLKELALQYSKSTLEDDDYKKVIDKYGLKTIIYSLFDKYGDRIDPANYKNKINEIPYEAVFDLSSLEDLEKCFKSYGSSRNILYGYLDKQSRIVYVGITQNPSARGNHYAKSDQENRAIAKALLMKRINKLIIFKSYLPTNSYESSSKLLRQLETAFAEKIFKTYSPENKRKGFEELINLGMLNIDKPGKNQNRYIITSIQNYVMKLADKSLLSSDEYEKELRLKFGDAIAIQIHSSKYSYLNFYLPNYILKHEGTWKSDFLRNNVGRGRSKWLFPQIRSLQELKEIINKAGISEYNKTYYIIRDWKKIHNKTNQNNTNDLDDNINIEDYK